MTHGIAGPNTEESLEEVLLLAAVLAATTGEQALRRSSRNDTIMVQKSVLLDLIKKIETAAPGMIDSLRSRLT